MAGANKAQNHNLVPTLCVALALLVIALGILSHKTRELEKDKDYFRRESFARKNEIDRLDQENKALNARLSAFHTNEPIKGSPATGGQQTKIPTSKTHQKPMPLEHQSQRISTPRDISPYHRNHICSLLKYKTRLNLEIACNAEDPEAYSLAKQIHEIFSAAGWQAGDIKLLDPSIPLKKTTIELSQRPPADIEHAMLPLLDVLGCKREAVLSFNLPENSMRIIVGSR
ncbi:MAG: hypothetical protein KKF30_10805 [Proteobacteria bacterium]|nr:hypothetical protein [Pseudomonadota bacterium]MBU4470854.1 hypothetical protein [Pseudomonadota bacterium]MCG2753774.1 hypothetical protein [Desulfobacteraceae bacterium]